MSIEPKKYLSRGEAAQYVKEKGLPLSKNTLQKYATVGGGPKFFKFGRRAVYCREDLNKWISDKLGKSVASTSEIGV